MAETGPMMCFHVHVFAFLAGACGVAFVAVDATAWKFADENFEAELANKVHVALGSLHANQGLAIRGQVLSKFNRDVCNADSSKGVIMRIQRYDVPRNKLLKWVEDQVIAAHDASEPLDDRQKSQIKSRIDFWTAVWFCNFVWPAVPRRVLSINDKKALAKIIMPDEAESLNPVIDGN